MGRMSIRPRTPRRRAAPANQRKIAGGKSKDRYEHYVTLARNAALSGDAVASENYYQHAEHYLRQMRAE